MITQAAMGKGARGGSAVWLLAAALLLASAAASLAASEAAPDTAPETAAPVASETAAPALPDRAAPAPPIAAPSPRESETIGQFGARICHSVMAGEIAAEAGISQRYHLVLEATGQSLGSYCGCVSLAFETNFPAQSAHMAQAGLDAAQGMSAILRDNMGACLPDTSDMIDETLVMRMPLHLQPDMEGCLAVLSDELWPTGLDLKDLRNRMRRAALNAGDLCSCVASQMARSHRQMNVKDPNPEYAGSRWADNLGSKMEECVKNP